MIGARILVLGGCFWVVIASGAAQVDWPTLHGNPQHTGFVPTELPRPFRLVWAVEFKGERLGTAMEPIVGGKRVFVATHSGSLYALEADSGQVVWRFSAHGPFLHSPAFMEGLALAGSEDGTFYAVEEETGRLRWSLRGDEGGFSAAPTPAQGRAFIGTRQGRFLAVEVSSGRLTWDRPLGAGIRQTAATDAGRLWVTTEDLRLHCLDANTGRRLWQSEPMTGQTARDYYPVVVTTAGRRWVVVRTNPILNMGQRIGRDRTFLCRQAGVDDSSWRTVEAWIKSEAARGTPELQTGEQNALRAWLDEHREARSFYLFDAETGAAVTNAPILWAAGCQGVGPPPAVTAEQRLLVLYRSAYGNWNLGVAPLVALGLLDPDRNQIQPLRHQSGPQPPWNTFWGTADESQNFVVAGDCALIVHQGTLSGFDFREERLFPLRGERDTFGGFPNPAWARNEWHGPARGGVAVAGRRVFWLTGSRLLCLAAGETGPAAAVTQADGAGRPAVSAPAGPPPTAAASRARLAAGVAETLERDWAPLWMDPGLAGREFAFDHAGEWFVALAWAVPHLPTELRTRAQAALTQAWRQCLPFTPSAWQPLDRGARREAFWLPPEWLARQGQGPRPHPFVNVYAAWLYARRCGAETAVLGAWPQIKAAYEEFAKSGWRLDPGKGDLWANSYLAALLALEKLAEQAGDQATAVAAHQQAQQTTEALVAWWRRAAERGTLAQFRGASELDPFIGQGDAISLRLAPHRHKVALLRGLTPEVGALVRQQAPEAVERVWDVFQRLYATWWLVGEERQVHFGENFIDPPDLALGGFTALAWLRDPSFAELARRVDLPFCRADLYHLVKLAVALEKAPE